LVRKPSITERRRTQGRIVPALACYCERRRPPFFVVNARAQLRFAMRVAKAMAKDERLPRSWRWAMGVALALKVMPAPDFGLDEVILLVCGVLLLTVHRETFRAIVSETRAAEAERQASHPPSRTP
jgi:hypothetical protein